MAVQVLAGIPFLAGVLGSLFGRLLSWLIERTTKRLAITLAVVISLAGLTAGFFAGVQALIATITYTAPPEVAIGMGLLMPSNTSACISAMLTAYTARYVYAWQVRIIQYKLL